MEGSCENCLVIAQWSVFTHVTSSHVGLLRESLNHHRSKTHYPIPFCLICGAVKDVAIKSLLPCSNLGVSGVSGCHDFLENFVRC